LIKLKDQDNLEKEIREAWNAPHATVPEEQVRKSWKELALKLRLRPIQHRKRNSRTLISVAASLLFLLGG